MSILPLGRSGGPTDVLPPGVHLVAGTIKRAAGAGAIHPGDLTTLSRVVPPGQLGECKPGTTITGRDEAGRRSTQIVNFVKQARSVGHQVFSALKGEGLAAGSLLRPGEATSVGAAMLKFPQLKRMVVAADAMVERHRQSTRAGRRSSHEAAHVPFDGDSGSSGWEVAAHELAPSVQALKRAVADDLHASGLLAWPPHVKGLAARPDRSPRLLELAGGNASLLSAVIADVVEARLPKGPGREAAAASLIHVLSARHWISVG
jgi:hypothetical protein